MNHDREQQGVALIFALGILSLILVMGMAFLGNALISQKISFNNRQAASARVFARSALDRALVQLTLFNVIQSGHHAEHFASDASSVFSRISGDAVNPTGSDQVDRTQDLLAGAASKLNVNNDSYFAGKESRARWIYVHENGKESAGAGKIGTEDVTSPIIARYAYQVLPQTSLSRVSLHAVTAGSYGFAGKTSADSSPRIAHKYRWGIDVDELVIPDAGEMFSHWRLEDPWSAQHEFDNFQNLLSGGASGGPLGPPRAGPPALTKETITNRKRWLRHVFVEGRGRVAREAYHNGGSGSTRVWYTRFNLSDGTPFYAANDDSHGNWYSRLLEKKPNDEDDEAAKISALKNTDVALERLAGLPDIFRDGLCSDKDDLVPQDPFSLGLPFLKRIGKNTEKGAFDTVEDLRKQIAANLNDYCDSDFVPTSDVPASTWGGLTDNSVPTIVPPTYTGNEKTLYINEIAFGFKLHNAKLDPEVGKCLFKVDGDGDRLKTELIAELVGVYKDLPASYTSLRLKGRLNSLKAKIRVSLKGKVQVTYVKEGTPHSKEVDLGDDGVYVEKVFELASARDIDVNAAASDTSTSWRCSPAGYWLTRVELTSDMQTGVSLDLTGKIGEKCDEAEGGAVTVTNLDKVEKVKVELVDVTFNLGNFALAVKHAADANNPAVDSWVDFVHVTEGERSTTGTLPVFSLNPSGTLPVLPTSDADGENWLAPGKLASATGNSKGFFYGGSMQAIDPRQNLNARLSNDDPNDWRNVFKPSLALISDSSETPSWAAFYSRLKGAVNVCSNPSAPMDAKGTALTAGTDCDKETATDPAWLGNGAGEHISTAVIRNRPMRSPWELGFIHRGIPFQTINLKKAGGLDGGATLAPDAHKAENFPNWASPTGTAYANGDAGILDQIKMTEYNKSFGKIDVATLVSPASAPNWWVSGGAETLGDLNLALYKSLFNNVRRDQTAAAFLAESENLKTATAEPSGNTATMPTALPAVDAFFDVSTLELRSKFFNRDAEQTLFMANDTSPDANDATRESLIGRIVNLIDAQSCSPANVYRIVIVAQTIRDMEGAGTQGKFDVSIDEATKTDPEKNVYIDQILGECRMLATVEKVTYLEGSGKTPRVKLRILQIEYLD